MLKSFKERRRQRQNRCISLAQIKKVQQLVINGIKFSHWDITNRWETTDSRENKQTIKPNKQKMSMKKFFQHNYPDPKTFSICAFISGGLINQPKQQSSACYAYFFLSLLVSVVGSLYWFSLFGRWHQQQQRLLLLLCCCLTKFRLIETWRHFIKY